MSPELSRAEIGQGGQHHEPQGCPVCVTLRNLWLTGEWTCPRCHGPSPEVAVQLRVLYSGAVISQATPKPSGV